jgi:hypothetical protein
LRENRCDDALEEVFDEFQEKVLMILEAVLENF